MGSEAAKLLDDAVARGDPPAVCACVIVDDEIVFESAHGAALDSIFDVASITKIAATTLGAALLCARGEIELDAPVARWLPAFGAHGKDRVTVRQLLGHRSGLPAWEPLFLDVMHDSIGREIFFDHASHSAWKRAHEIMIARVCASRVDRPGQRVYSDLGFLALGALIEAVAGRLDSFVHREVLAPLVHSDIGFVDLSEPSRWLDGRHVLATGATRPREPAPGQEGLYAAGRAIEHDGAVDDDNAYAMGGIAGHAGLFATAPALAQLGFRIIEELDGAERLGIGATLRGFVAPDPAEGPVRGLGFDHPSAEGSSTGTLFGRLGPRGAVGHLGFTGCSLWLDLDRRISAALLTNRTLPGRHRVDGIRALRRAFHDAICRALG